MPRNLTVIAILQTVTEEAAMALQMLKRQGYSISIILNHASDALGMDMMALLVSQRMTVHALPEESSVPFICQSLLAMR